MFKDLWKAPVEKFYVLHLNNKNVVQAIQLISTGSLTASIVHPREVYKAALIANSVAVIFVHNHPRGDPTPSNEDIEITERLIEVGRVVGVSALDHIIVGDGEYYTLRDKGLF